MNCVIPFAVKFVAMDYDFCKFFVRDLSRYLIVFAVDPVMHFQASCCSRIANKANNHFECFKRDALPIACDVAEQFVFNFVPLACARSGKLR